MKQFNHKKLNQVIRSCAVNQDAQGNIDGAMSIKILSDLIEICDDCKCFACNTLLQDFQIAKVFAELGDMRNASRNITAACLKMPMLIAQANASQN